MPKYLIEASYTRDGVKGLVKDGGSKRREAVEQLLRSVGGKLDALYFALGQTDAFAIVDLPDNVSVAAASLAVNAAGLVQMRTTVLLTPEEMDQATKKSVGLRAPGT